jgi:hypothetical protein
MNAEQRAQVAYEILYDGVIVEDKFIRIVTAAIREAEQAQREKDAAIAEDGAWCQPDLDTVCGDIAKQIREQGAGT